MLQNIIMLQNIMLQNIMLQNIISDIQLMFSSIFLFYRLETVLQVLLNWIPCEFRCA